MELEMRHMEMVCRIQEAGSLSKAARLLGVSQPSLTAALHRIEKAAGGKLFERSRHGIMPTDLGTFLLNRARPLINEIKALNVALRQRAERGQCKQLRVIIAPGPYLGRFITSLEERWSDHDVCTTVDYGVAEHIQRLASSRLEAAIIGYSPDVALQLPSGVRARHLVDAEPCWVAMSDRHPLAAQPDVSLYELSDQDWIAPPGGDLDGTTDLFEAACREAGFAPHIRYRLDDVSAVTQVLSGTHAVIIAQPTCRHNPGVVARPLRDNPLLFRLSFVWRATALSHHEADDMFRLLVRAYAEVIGNNEPYPVWWRQNPWAHTDPAWAQIYATATSSS